MTYVRGWLSTAVWLALILAGLLVVNIGSLRLQGYTYRIDMDGGVDKLLLDNVYNPEEDSTGTTYRWTQDTTSLSVHNFVAVNNAFLALKIGGVPTSAALPRALHMRVDGAPWTTLSVTTIPRHYMLLLPPAVLLDGNLDIEFSSDVSKVEPDIRMLGIRIDSIALGWFPTAQVFPTWAMLLAQWGIVILAIAIAWRLELPRWASIGVAVVCVLALGWMTGSQLLIAAAWQARLLVVGLALLALVWSTFPLLCRVFPQARARAELRWLWRIALVAISIRMIGVLYPPFDSHDHYIHRSRILEFIAGSMLVYDKPAEFSTKLTVVPAAPYILYIPFTLLTDNVLVAMQGVYAFLDGITVLLVGIFARSIGANARASRLAALIMALFPLNLVALWWGFGPQVIGQFLVVLIALLIVYSGRRTPVYWAVAGVVVVLMLLSHIGAGMLGAIWLAGYVLLAWWFERDGRRYWNWKWWGATLILSGIVVTLLLYIDVIALQLSGLSSNKRLGWDEGDLFRVVWTLQSLYSSFNPLGVVLPVVSLVVLMYMVQPAYRWFIGVGLATAGLFLVVDLLFGLQVRYAYFLVPFIAIGLAMLLDRLIVRHRSGWLIAGCLLGLIAIAGLSLWFDGFFLYIKPSLRGLTH